MWHQNYVVDQKSSSRESTIGVFVHCRNVEVMYGSVTDQNDFVLHSSVDVSEVQLTGCVLKDFLTTPRNWAYLRRQRISIAVRALRLKQTQLCLAYLVRFQEFSTATETFEKSRVEVLGCPRERSDLGV